MLLSSFSFSVEYSHALLFEEHFKQVVIHQLKRDGGIEDLKFYKLLTELDNGANTLSLQLFFEDMEHFMEFELNKKEPFIADLENRFKGHYVYFHTLLEEC